ncbi:MAG: hypothetical protein GKR89_33280 [Candidatus Latescibacteria bacterium]|nr:hypothetical protein [Candidatus Latescibacterota bacterium]
MPTIAAADLEDITARVFVGIGVPKDDARLVAGLLIKANLAGHDSHGVVRIPSYVAGISAGRICPGAAIAVEDDNPSMARLRGNDNFGQVVLSRAVDLALEKSATQPLAMVSATQYSHCGQLGSYAEMLARQDLVGLVLLGKQRGAVVPWGGRTGRMYQTTLAVAVPSRGPFPVVLDMATSVAPFGKILVKRARDEPCPEGWIVDAEGKPATDPHLDFNKGEAGMLPLGGEQAGNKGSGLTFILGLLTTALSGAGATLEGTLVMAIDPTVYMSLDDFLDQVDGYVDYLHQSEPAAGFDSVLVPGQRSHEETQRRLGEGIWVEEDTWEKIQRLLPT